MKTPIQTFHAGIAIGISLITSLTVFFHGFLGFEQWVAFISSHWLNLHWGVGIFFLVWTVLSYFYFRREL